MEKLIQLLNEAKSLNSYAEWLESSIVKVATIKREDEAGDEILPDKLQVLESMADAVKALRNVAGQMVAIKSELNNNNQENE